MSNIDWDSIARQAYSAYAQVTDWKNYQGYQMPQWEILTDKIRQAWVASCKETVRVTKNAAINGDANDT